MQKETITLKGKKKSHLDGLFIIPNKANVPLNSSIDLKVGLRVK